MKPLLTQYSWPSPETQAIPARGSSCTWSSCHTEQLTSEEEAGLKLPEAAVTTKAAQKLPRERPQCSLQLPHSSQW